MNPPAPHDAPYDAQRTEAKWQRIWAERRTFEAREDPGKPKYYVLEMFPYPSGRIHMGHVRNYTLGDVVARYKRARGFSVLHPMGWDAFGLPAENAAREQNVHPAAWTYGNIANMRDELKAMGLSLDWSRELATCHPGYYARQQKLFLDMYEAGLAYRGESWVNWDPVDHTVLANEQVIDGRGWRSGAPVEKRKLSQWFFRITAFADDLLEALNTLDRWPPQVRTMQRNWIGRSEGLAMSFEIVGRDDGLDVYTTRHDTIFGASFMALSADHPLASEAAGRDPGAAAFVAECRRTGTSEEAVETAEKKGHDTGLRVRHPFDEGRGAARLHRQFRADGVRYGGHLRLSRARPAGPRLRARVRAPRAAGRRSQGRGRPPGSGSTTKPSSRPAMSFSPIRGSSTASPWTRRRRRSPKGSNGRARGGARSTTASATGECPGSDTGAARSP